MDILLQNEINRCGLDGMRMLHAAVSFFESLV